VEIAKAWETSWTRRELIAIVPALAFVLSTLALPIFKKIWVRKLR